MNASRPIYMDHNATTPLDERVLDAMMPYLRGDFGNPASTEHRYGWVAEDAVKRARAQIAEDLGAQAPREIIFTSGATESNNLAILGVMRRYSRKGAHLITARTEHKAILDPCRAWEAEGGTVTYLDVDQDGLIDMDQLEAAVTDETVLVSIMAANNEIGVLQPVAQIGRLCRARGVLFHSDATQAVGKVPLHVDQDHIDLLSLSAHKLYGPKGVGVLYVRRKQPRVSLQPLQYGGGHELGMRSGTLNVPGIVGLAHALRLCMEERDEEATRLHHLRSRLQNGIQEHLPDVLVNGSLTKRTPGNLNLYFPNVDLAKLIQEIYGRVAVSTGAACTSASPQPSHVLKALTADGRRAAASVRFGLGRHNTEAQVDQVIHIFIHAVALAHLRPKTATIG